MKLTERQYAVLKRMTRGGALFARLEPSATGTEHTRGIGTTELSPMTVNALSRVSGAAPGA
jgi:hypothetical protein